MIKLFRAMNYTPPPKKKREREEKAKGKTPQGLYKNVHKSQTHMPHHLGTEASTL
jgi:hypothetical protein